MTTLKSLESPSEATLAILYSSLTISFANESTNKEAEILVWLLIFLLIEPLSWYSGNPQKRPIQVESLALVVFIK